MITKSYSVKITNGEKTFEEKFVRLQRADDVFRFYLCATLDREIFLTRIALCVGNNVMKEYNNLDACRECKTLNW